MNFRIVEFSNFQILFLKYPPAIPPDMLKKTIGSRITNQSFQISKAKSQITNIIAATLCKGATIWYVRFFAFSGFEK